MGGLGETVVGVSVVVVVQLLRWRREVLTGARRPGGGGYNAPHQCRSMASSALPRINAERHFVARTWRKAALHAYACMQQTTDHLPCCGDAPCGMHKLLHIRAVKASALKRALPNCPSAAGCDCAVPSLAQHPQAQTCVPEAMQRHTIKACNMM